MLPIRLQIIYYLLMGIWPLVHMHSFEAVTGKKTDTWLVRTIAWFFIAVALQIWLVDDPRDAAAIGLGSALIIGGADIWYAVRGRIRYIYLFDAPVQLFFVLAWILILAA